MNDRFYSCAKALVATVRAGSMSAAAAELNTTKSAISQKLALFEAELGLVLLDRSGRAVAPTAAGRRIFEVCAEPVDAALEAEAQLGFLRGGKIAGRVSVSGPNSLLGTIFVPLLAGLQSRYPDIELELHADDSKSDFAAEDIDLAFRTGPTDKGRFVSAALPSAQRAPYASPALAEQTPPFSRPADLARLPFVLRMQEPGKWAFQNHGGQQESIEPPISLRVNTMELAYAAVLAGQGAALLPSLLAQEDVQAGRLVRLIPDWSAAPVPMTLLCRPERLAAPPVAAVRRHILDACGNSGFLGTELQVEAV
ncbi:LysR family transcriptional regulator [Leisingera aquaemixtae]|uniref:LysR family transcriptional regulator n=1 Tax=Leisingera aquaemixtae TaxID=1396826 RepID=UPI001C93EC49|nr:LysR family transcriptional regulator [Leisingera aquaemixtae]MBY6068958.1 LysR family transcriptional regulator [Leisingera aquaemixtae]